MTFNNSVMVKRGEGGNCLDPYNASLKVKIRKTSSSLRCNSMLQTEIKGRVGVGVGGET